MLGGGQNGLSVILEASYALSVGQNSLSTPLQVTNTHGGDQNRLSQHLQVRLHAWQGLKHILRTFQAPYTLGGGENGLYELL